MQAVSYESCMMEVEGKTKKKRKNKKNAYLHASSMKNVSGMTRKPNKSRFSKREILAANYTFQIIDVGAQRYIGGIGDGKCG
jgi:hypothetical protein